MQIKGKNTQKIQNDNSKKKSSKMKLKKKLANQWKKKRIELNLNSVLTIIPKQ